MTECVLSLSLLTSLFQQLNKQNGSQQKVQTHSSPLGNKVNGPCKHVAFSWRTLSWQLGHRKVHLFISRHLQDRNIYGQINWVPKPSGNLETTVLYLIVNWSLQLMAGAC